MDRLRAAGSRHTLEAELRIGGIQGDPEECDFTVFSPEFREAATIMPTAIGCILQLKSIESNGDSFMYIM